MDGIRNTPSSRQDTDFDWQTLIQPAAAYRHPRDVLRNANLSNNEKRAILSSWASDACAVASLPALRQPPGAPAPVSFDDIIDALRALDDDDPPPRPGGRTMRPPRSLTGCGGEGDSGLPQAV